MSGDAVTSFLARMLAESEPDIDAAHVENDARLASGVRPGQARAIAEALTAEQRRREQDKRGAS